MCSDCRKWHFRGSSFQNFPGEDTPVPPYKTRAFGARSRTKHFWLATPLVRYTSDTADIDDASLFIDILCGIAHIAH